jgi:SAM-dependent methyltransferase
LYIAFNWNLRIGWHILRQELRGEKKYNIDTTGSDDLKLLEQRGIDTTHATIYMPVSYDLIEKIFSIIPDTQRNHFLDIGCGKGRALCVAAHHGYPKLTGIDFSKELCTAAEKNLDRTKQKYGSLQFDIVHNDAFYFDIPADVDCIFLFNPFDEVIMSGVTGRILESIHKYPRKLFIAYANPLYKSLLTDEGFTEIFYSREKNYLELSILTIV